MDWRYQRRAWFVQVRQCLVIVNFRQTCYRAFSDRLRVVSRWWVDHGVQLCPQVPPTLPVVHRDQQHYVCWGKKTPYFWGKIGQGKSFYKNIGASVLNGVVLFWIQILRDRGIPRKPSRDVITRGFLGGAQRRWRRHRDGVGPSAASASSPSCACSGTRSSPGARWAPASATVPSGWAWWCTSWTGRLARARPAAVCCTGDVSCAAVSSPASAGAHVPSFESADAHRDPTTTRTWRRTTASEKISC